MASREKYTLVFWLSDPRSADIVLKTEVIPHQAFPMILPGQARHALWGRETHPCRIIATGTKTALQKLRVSRDGELLLDVGPESLAVTTRRKAIAEIKSRAQKNRMANQDNLDQLVLVAAAGPAPQPAPAAPGPEILSIAERIHLVPALQNHAGDEAWVTLGASDVWVNKNNLHCIYKRKKKSAVKLYRSLLLELITEELYQTGRLSSTGKRGTVKVPQKLVNAALAYTSANCKQDFDVSRTTTNFFGMARKLRVQREKEAAALNQNQNLFNDNGRVYQQL